MVYANVFGSEIYPAVNSGDSSIAAVPTAVSQGSSTSFADRFGASVRKTLTASNSSVVTERRPVAAAPAAVSHGSLFSFADRFAAAAPDSVAPKPAPASPPRQVAALTPAERDSAAPMPSPRPSEANADKRSGAASVREMAERREHAKAVAMIASADKDKPEKPPSIFERLFGKWQSAGPALAYASADASSTSSLGLSRNIGTAGTEPLYDRQTAVYDISAHTVYLPDGTKLEAHSGLGSKLDDPSSASVRMRGVTPPHLYDLKPREALFHGVAALRLNPVGGESAIYGRAGLLAHTYMLGPNGDSNGCVSFRDYNRFLQAYRSGEIKRLAVVARL